LWTTGQVVIGPFPFRDLLVNSLDHRWVVAMALLQGFVQFQAHEHAVEAPHLRFA
jgi:hypothetical protein